MFFCLCVFTRVHVSVCFEALKRPGSCFFFLFLQAVDWTMSLFIHCVSVCPHMVYNGDITKVCCGPPVLISGCPVILYFPNIESLKFRWSCAGQKAADEICCQSCQDGNKTVVMDCIFDIYNFDILIVAPETVNLISILEAHRCVFSYVLIKLFYFIFLFFGLIPIEVY